MKKNKFCIANWKMYLNNTESINYINIFNNYDFDNDCKIVICPSFTSLSDVGKLNCGNFSLGSQDISDYKKGAYTGQISLSMIENLNCSYTIVGHSEIRKYFNETDIIINKKISQIYKTNITPVICIGESLIERNNKLEYDVISNQLKCIFNGIDINSDKDIIIAYEPVWAIGTGESANMEIIDSMHSFIKNIIEKIIPNNRNIYLLYGGSVDLSNSKKIIELENVDGFLIGSSSLKPDVFYGIYQNLKGEN